MGELNAVPQKSDILMHTSLVTLSNPENNVESITQGCRQKIQNLYQLSQSTRGLKLDK